jgi:hypothetical protein
VAITFGVATAAGTNTGAGLSGSGDLTIPLPTSWAAEQLAIIVLYLDGGTASTPTGWTIVSGAPWGSATPKLYAFTRFLQAGDSNPITTISSSGTLCSVGAIVTYNGVNTTTPVEVVGAASAGTGTPMTAAEITTLTAAAFALGLCGRGDNEVAGSQTFGGSATGVTERLDSGTLTGDDAEVSLYDKEIASPGATGAGSATTSATDPWVSVIIALKPAPANHALTANGLAAGAPVLATPTLSQVHGLTASGLAAGAPVLATPTLTQVHALTANGLATGAPVLATPTLTVQANHALTANGLSAGAPVLATPTISQAHALTANGLAAGAPVLTVPTLAQIHALVAQALNTGAPTLAHPALAEEGADDHNLVANGLATGAPTLGSPSLAQVHALIANALTLGAPTIGTPTLGVAGAILEYLSLVTPADERIFIDAQTIESIRLATPYMPGLPEGGPQW